MKNDMGMNFPGIKRMSVADEVFETLHQRILSGTLKPGDKLQSQDELARQFGVSRNTLREAVYKLTVLGLLTSKQGVGTVVNTPRASTYMAALSDHLLLEASTVREFLEARMLIEKTNARLAAIRATPENIRRIRETIVQQEAAYRIRDIDAFSRFDAEFHFEMAGASRNKVLTKFLETIRDMLKTFIEEVSRLPGSVEDAMTFHKNILNCIVSGRAEDAEKEMFRHLYDVAKRIRKNLHVDLDLACLLELKNQGGSTPLFGITKEKKA